MSEDLIVRLVAIAIMGVVGIAAMILAYLIGKK